MHVAVTITYVLNRTLVCVFNCSLSNVDVEKPTARCAGSSAAALLPAALLAWRQLERPFLVSVNLGANGILEE